MATASVEIWKNTAPGMRWMTTINALGNDTSKVVRGLQTFNLTTLERQMNQEKAASRKQDLFRNGCFVLVKAGKDTNLSEIESTDSLTDIELTQMAHEIQAGNTTVQDVMAPIASPQTMARLRETLVLEGASVSDVQTAKERIAELEGGPEVRRAAAAGGDGASRIPDTSDVDGELKGDSKASPGREIVAERAK